MSGFPFDSRWFAVVLLRVASLRCAFQRSHWVAYFWKVSGKQFVVFELVLDVFEYPFRVRACLGNDDRKTNPTFKHRINKNDRAGCCLALASRCAQRLVAAVLCDVTNRRNHFQMVLSVCHKESVSKIRFHKLQRVGKCFVASRLVRTFANDDFHFLRTLLSH